jgi:hypothetical protein
MQKQPSLFGSCCSRFHSSTGMLWYLLHEHCYQLNKLQNINPAYDGASHRPCLQSTFAEHQPYQQLGDSSVNTIVSLPLSAGYHLH